MDLTADVTSIEVETTMSNQFDTRIRDANEIFQDVRILRGDTKGPVALAILGTHNVDCSALIAALREQWREIEKFVKFEPKLIMTGCATVGTEKAARLVAKSLTGRAAVVIHRATTVFTVAVAEETRDVLMAREADALLVIGANACKHVRERFTGWHKVVHEVIIG